VTKKGRSLLKAPALASGKEAAAALADLLTDSASICGDRIHRASLGS
jgi:hypothetical protein